jgi:hypothetical protein
MFDVTEASAADDRDLMFDVFTRLRILGVGLSLDNFGTGLSSLTELYRMPYSEIKVDQSLIADVPREREAQLIVRAIADLAHTLQLRVCAEGIETREMLEFARSAGFDSAQGHFFSSPVAAGEIEQLVRAWPGLGSSASGRWHGMQTLPMDGAATSLSRQSQPAAARSSLGGGQESGREHLGGQRLAEQEPLGLVALQQPQQAGLLIGFDPFRD